MSHKNPSVLILYHFYKPDDVASARHFSDFAEGLKKRNWDVTVLTSNRYCRYRGKSIRVKREICDGVRVIRSYRPDWSQSDSVMRLANSAWMMVSWVNKVIKEKDVDIIVIGSDPQFSQLIFPVLHLIKRRPKKVFWCFDLFPDAIIADNIHWFLKRMAQFSSFIIRFCYRYIDAIVDIGPCMRKRIERYSLSKNVKKITLTPWALAEINKFCPVNSVVRKKYFGNSKLVLLYSGNLGRAHDFSLFLTLARILRKKKSDIDLFFSIRGNRVNEFKESLLKDDYNIKLIPFSDERDFHLKLIAADIHLLSLREEWSGIVVPSKFFGSLASGRPILYAGPEDSSIAEWIRMYKLGYVLTKENIDKIAEKLIDLSKSPREKVLKMGVNAFNIYKENFSKEKILDKWNEFLLSLIC